MPADDADDLSWGFRSRLGVLIVLILAALGAAVWSGTREHGQGKPEDRRLLMVVTQPDSTVNYYAVLERGGFGIEVDSLSDWEATARAELPDSEASGVALVLELADVRGVGFAVFEQPAALDLSGLELEPSLAEIDDLSGRAYAVLSVGDLSFPHHLTVDAVGDDPVLRMPGHAVYEALFAQPALLAREVEDRPTIEELQFEDSIQGARWMLERPATFAAAIEFARTSLDGALAVDAQVRRLVDGFETGSAVPTPDGGMLVVHHALEPVSMDAKELELRPASHMRIDWLGPEALAGGDLASAKLDLQPCPSLAGGELELAKRPRLEAAIDGSALAISMDGSATLWRKLDAPGCTWAELAKLPLLEDGLSVIAPKLGAEQRSIMAEVAHDDRGTVVRLWLTPEPIEQGMATHEVAADPMRIEGAVSLELFRLADTKIGALTFVDDLHVAALARLPLPSKDGSETLWAEHAIELLDRRRPGVHLRIPTEFFAEGRALREIVSLAAAVPGERGPSFALTTVVDGLDTELITLTIRDAAWQRFEQAMAETEPEPTLFTLTPDELEVRSLTRGPAIAALGFSPRANAGAGLLSFAPTDGGPAEVAVIGLDGGAPTLLTSNKLIDTLPHLTADGRHLTFVTAVRSSLDEMTFSVPRIVSVPQ